jgi:hypothetical protein
MELLLMVVSPSTVPQNAWDILHLQGSFAPAPGDNGSAYGVAADNDEVLHWPPSIAWDILHLQVAFMFVVFLCPRPTRQRQCRWSAANSGESLRLLFERMVEYFWAIAVTQSFYGEGSAKADLAADGGEPLCCAARSIIPEVLSTAWCSHLCGVALSPPAPTTMVALPRRLSLRRW